jgi:hypothetical protein
MTLAEEMTAQQLDDFEALINGGDEGAALHWLQEHFPNYRDTVRTKLEELKSEILLAAPVILAASDAPTASPSR